MSTFRLLVTKKISPSLVLQAGLKGVEVMEKEFIRISPVMNEQLGKRIHRLSLAKNIVAFTSRNAVKAIAADHQLSKAEWSIFCIQGTTSEEVKKYFGEEKIRGTARNAAALASVIIEKSDDKKILFFCGSKRMDDLPGILRSQGYDVEEIMVYKTETDPQKIIDDYNAVAFFSPSSVESFFSVNKLKENIACLSVGKTTTESIRKFTANNIITAENASEENIIKIAVSLNNK